MNSVLVDNENKRTDQATASHDQPVLEIDSLAISYETRTGDVEAVRDVSFQIHRRETLGLVGESGCGKSSVAYGIVGFLGRNGRIVDGRIKFLGQNLQKQSKRQLRRLCGNQISMVYQDPAQALNPSMRIGELLREALLVHQDISEREADTRSKEMLERVYMPDPGVVMTRYPHQLSGGQQQRVLIAMALLNNPALLIMDEPTTALDVTVEAAVLDLVDDLRHEFDTAILYISHNMGVIARIADRVSVMYAGEVVEAGPVEDIFLQPAHPYTQALIRCVPQLGMSKQKDCLQPIRGQVPNPDDLPPGCLFEPRCPFAREACAIDHPPLIDISVRRKVRCPFTDSLGSAAAEDAQERVLSTPEVVTGSSDSILLEADHVKTYYEQSSNSLASLFGLGDKEHVKAVDDISFELPKGSTLGIVGESGCGKSTLAKTIVGLEPLTDGSIDFLGFDISVPVRQRDLELIRAVQMVFQNPDSTLNPSFKVGFQIGRPFVCFGDVPRSDIQQEVHRLLDAVRLDQRYADRLPRQLSGGEKQRVAIARVLAARPDLVVCDEPVSSLDVSVQAAVLNLLLKAQEESSTTLLFIAHDLSVVRFLSDCIGVMYLGRIAEIGLAEKIYSPPYHPYTEALLSAVPIPNPHAEQKHIRLSGSVPSALEPPNGCRFHTRCPRKLGAICEDQKPPARQDGADHVIYCHIPMRELRKMDPVVNTTS
jgi:peptide/nickel transport system ATP-binding protein